MKPKVSQVKLGMIISYINLIVGNLIPFFYTPLMLELMGQNEYGLYRIATSTTSYLTLMTFGLGSAVSRFLIKSNVEGGKDAEERTFGLFNLIFHIISVLTLLVGTIIVLCLPIMYGESLGAASLRTLQVLVGLMVINTAVGFSYTAYNSVATSHERFVFIQIINLISTIGVPVLNLIALLMGYKSIGLTIVSLIVTISIRVIYLIYIRGFIKLKPRYKSMPTKMFKEIISFSFWVFLASIVSQINTSTDTIIIGMVPELAAIGAAVYSIGYTFPNMIFSATQVLPGFFTPKVTRMVFEGADNKTLTDLVIKVGRLQCYIVSLIVSGFIAFGQPFIQWYAGVEYAEAYWVAIIIMIPNCIPLVQTVANSIIHAKNMHRFRSIVYLFIAIFNVIGTVLLVNEYGIIGAAIPTGVSYVIGQGFVMNWYYWKKVGLEIPRFWKSLLPCLTVGAVMCIVTLNLHRFINFYDKANLLIGIGVYTVIFAFISWVLLFNAEEKQTVLSAFRKINVFKKKA